MKDYKHNWSSWCCIEHCTSMTPITAWSPTKIWTVDNHFGKPSLIQALMATAVEERPEAPLPNWSFHHQLPALHPNPTDDSSAWTWEPGDERIKLQACHGTVSRGFEPCLDGPAFVGVAIWRHNRIFHQLIADRAAQLRWIRHPARHLGATRPNFVSWRKWFDLPKRTISTLLKLVGSLSLFVGEKWLLLRICLRRHNLAGFFFRVFPRKRTATLDLKTSYGMEYEFCSTLHYIDCASGKGFEAFFAICLAAILREGAKRA